jgi:hypothetical protein
LRALGYDQPNWATILTRKPQMPLDRPMIRPESEFDISGCVPTICTCDIHAPTADGLRPPYLQTSPGRRDTVAMCAFSPALISIGIVSPP